MKAGQKLEKDGKQVCLFPMEIMNITQWSSPSEYSHCCGHPFDNAISGQVSVPVYAPFDCHLINTYASGNTRVFQSDNKVQTQRGISNRSLDARRTVINAFFEWCCNEEYINRNPCRNIKKIKYEEKERKPLSSIELEELRNACVTLRDKALFELLYSTGCRVSEVVNLNKADVNFETKEVVLFGKGNKHRISYINARAEIALKNYLNSRNDDNKALFVSDRKPHKRLSKFGIEKRIGQLGELAGIERRIFPHLIRHTTATDGLNRGMGVEEVQAILGHENIATTMIYAKVSKNNVKLHHTKCIV